MRVKTLAQILITEPNRSSMSANVEYGALFGTLEYLVRVGIGNPPSYQYMVVDTGSDLPWIQCQPCFHCYPQFDPIYDPKQSSSYSEASCESTKCQFLGKYHSCENQQCKYKMSYGDGSSSAGLLAYDTFRFGNTKVSSIAFGCGHQNEGFVNSGGILGLGRGDLSFLNQLGGKSAGIFSYCLVEPGSEACIGIGDETIANGAAWIPIMYNPRADPSYYYLENMVVPIPEQAFQLNYKGQGGVILDTGTVITRFPRASR
ncbi:hypothetical protein Tsubulata_034926, partial [Turnera subulata]